MYEEATHALRGIAPRNLAERAGETDGTGSGSASISSSTSVQARLFASRSSESHITSSLNASASVAELGVTTEHTNFNLVVTATLTSTTVLVLPFPSTTQPPFTGCPPDITVGQLQGTLFTRTSNTAEPVVQTSSSMQGAVVSQSDSIRSAQAAEMASTINLDVIVAVNPTQSSIHLLLPSISSSLSPKPVSCQRPESLTLPISGTTLVASSIISPNIEISKDGSASVVPRESSNIGSTSQAPNTMTVRLTNFQTTRIVGGPPTVTTTAYQTTTVVVHQPFESVISSDILPSSIISSLVSKSSVLELAIPFASSFISTTHVDLTSTAIIPLPAVSPSTTTSTFFSPDYYTVTAQLSSTSMTSSELSPILVSPFGPATSSVVSSGSSLWLAPPLPMTVTESSRAPRDFAQASSLLEGNRSSTLTVVADPTLARQQCRNDNVASRALADKINLAAMMVMILVLNI